MAPRITDPAVAEAITQLHEIGLQLRRHEDAVLELGDRRNKVIDRLHDLMLEAQERGPQLHSIPGGRVS